MKRTCAVAPAYVYPMYLRIYYRYLLSYEGTSTFEGI